MNKSAPIIAFDLHGVVFRLDWRQIFNLWWHYSHKVQLLLCCLDPRMVWYGFKLLLNDATDEEGYALFERYHPAILPFIIECTHTQKPVEGIVELLHKLTANGYRLHIVSNIGPRRFKELKKRFPQIIDLFEAAQITNGDVADMIKKPQQRFFNAYVRDYAAGNQQIFFIDDSKGNLKAAKQVGIITIRFKNAAQVAAQLKAYKL